MLDITAQIKSLLDWESLSDIRSYWSPIEPYSQVIYGDVSFIEAVKTFTKIRAIVIDKIEHWDFDNFSYTKRQTILELFQQLNRLSIQFRNSVEANKDWIVVNLIEYIDKSFSILTDMWIFNKTISSLKEERKRIENLILETQKLRDELSITTETLNKVKILHSNAEQWSTIASAISEIHKNYEEKTREYSRESEIIIEGLRQKKSDLDGVESQINQVKGGIEVFAGTIDTMETNYDSLKQRAEKIIQEIEDKQKEITEQLQKATGLWLFQNFSLAENKYKANERMLLGLWIFSLIIFAIFSFMFAQWVNERLDTFQKNSTYTNNSVSNGITTQSWSWKMDSSTNQNELASKAELFIFWTNLFLRLLVLGPVLYLVIFLKKQHTRAQNLSESYGFRSIVSLSLPNYQDLLDKTEKESVQRITETAMERVFSHPMLDWRDTEDSSNIDNAEKTIDKVLDFIKKVRDIWN